MGSVRVFAGVKTAAHLALGDSFLAQFDALWLRVTSPTTVSDIRALAPSIRMLAWGDPYRAAGPEFADPHTPQTEHPDWVAKVALPLPPGYPTGAEIADARDPSYIAMDPQVAGWQTEFARYWHDDVMQAVGEELDGIVMDPLHESQPEFIRGAQREFVANYSPPAWLLASASMLQAVIDKTTDSTKVVYNGLGFPSDNNQRNDAFVVLGTGLVYEAPPLDDDAAKQWLWVDGIKVGMASALALGREFYLAASATAPDAATRLYAVSAFLQYQEANTYLALSDGGTPAWWDEFDVDLGDALGPTTEVAGGAYVRQFGGGYVVVNPTDHVVDVELPMPSEAERWQRYSNGWLTNTIRLQPFSGEILTPSASSVVSAFPVPVNLEDLSTGAFGGTERQQVVTAVIQVAEGDLPANNIELSALGALWTSQRTHVQWIGQGEPYRNPDGSFNSWRFARCYFEVGSVPALEKAMTIHKAPAEVSSQNYTLTPAVSGWLAGSPRVSIWLNGVETAFDIGTGASLDAHRVEPVSSSTRDIVRFYEFNIRLTNEPRMFAWLCLEIPRYQSELKFWLHVGHSRVRDYRSFGNTQDPNLFMPGQTLAFAVSGGNSMAFIRNSTFTTMARAQVVGSTLFTLLDWSTDRGVNELTHNRLPVGSGQGYQGVILTDLTTQSALAAAEEDIASMCDNWDVFGQPPLDAIGPPPKNGSGQVMSKAEARASLKGYLTSTLKPKMIARRPYGISRWGVDPNVTKASNQWAAFGAQRGWAFMCCGSPSLNRFLQWVNYKQLLRPQNFVNEDGSLFRAWDHPQCSFFSSTLPNNSDLIDRLGYAIAAFTGPVPDNGDGGWAPMDKEHHEIHWENAYAMATGDRLALRIAAMAAQSMAASIKTGLPGDDGLGPTEHGSHWDSGSRIYYRTISARGFGRPTGAALELLHITGNPDLRHQIRAHMVNQYDGLRSPVNGVLDAVWSGAWHQGEFAVFQTIFGTQNPYLNGAMCKPWMEGTCVVSAYAASLTYAKTDPVFADKMRTMAWRIGKTLAMHCFFDFIGKTHGIIRCSTTVGHPWIPPNPGDRVREIPTGRVAQVIAVFGNLTAGPRWIYVKYETFPLYGGFTWDYDNLNNPGVVAFKCSTGNFATTRVPTLLGVQVDGNNRPTGVPLTREQLEERELNPPHLGIWMRYFLDDAQVGETWTGSGVAVALKLAKEKRDVVVARRARYIIQHKFGQQTGFGSDSPAEDWLSALGAEMWDNIQHHGRAVGANIGYQVSYRYQTEMWLNVCRAASAWAEFDISSNQPTFKPPIGMDVWPNNGYPTAYRPNTLFESLLFGRLNDQGGNPNWKWPRPGSVWRIRATGDGAARLVVHHDGTTTTFANITTLDTTITAAGHSSWKLRLYDGILTSCVVIPDEFTAEYDAGKQLNPRWIAKEGGKLEVLRDLNLNGTIGGIYTWPPIQQDGSCTPLCVIQVERWSDRRPKNAYSYNAQFFNSDEWRYDTVGAWTGASALERTVTGRTSGRIGLLRGGVSGTPGSVLIKRQNLAGDLHFTNGEWLDDNFGNSIRLATPMNARFDAITRISEQYCPHDAFVDLCVELYEATGRLRYGWICLQTAAKREGELAHNGVAVPVGDGYVEELGKYIKQKLGPISDAGQPVLVMGFEFSNEVWNPLPGVTDVDYIEDYISRWPQYRDWPFGIRVLNTQALRSNDLMDAIRLQVSGREHLIYRILALQRSPNCDNVYNGRGDSGNDPYIPTWLHHDALAWAPYLDPRGGWMTEPTCEATVDYIEQVPLPSWLAPTNPENWTGTYATQMARVATIGHGKYEVCYYEGFTHHLRDPDPDRFEILQCADRHPRMGGIITQMLDHFHENSAPENWRATLCAMFMLWDPNAGQEAWGIWYHPDDTTSPRGIALDTHLDSHYEDAPPSVNVAGIAFAFAMLLPTVNVPETNVTPPTIAFEFTPQAPTAYVEPKVRPQALFFPTSFLTPAVTASRNVTVPTRLAFPMTMLAPGHPGQAPGVPTMAFPMTTWPPTPVNDPTFTLPNALAFPMTTPIPTTRVDQPQDVVVPNALDFPLGLWQPRLQYSQQVTVPQTLTFALTTPAPSYQSGATVQLTTSVRFPFGLLLPTVGIDVNVDVNRAIPFLLQLHTPDVVVVPPTTVVLDSPIAFAFALQLPTLQLTNVAVRPPAFALPFALTAPEVESGSNIGVPNFALTLAMHAPSLLGHNISVGVPFMALGFGVHEPDYNVDDDDFYSDAAEDLARLVNLGELSEVITWWKKGDNLGVDILAVVERFEREETDEGTKMVRGAFLHVPKLSLLGFSFDDEFTLALREGDKPKRYGVAGLTAKDELTWTIQVRE